MTDHDNDNDNDNDWPWPGYLTVHDSAVTSVVMHSEVVLAHDNDTDHSSVFLHPSN